MTTYVGTRRHRWWTPAGTVRAGGRARIRSRAAQGRARPRNRLGGAPCARMRARLGRIRAGPRGHGGRGERSGRLTPALGRRQRAAGTCFRPRPSTALATRRALDRTFGTHLRIGHFEEPSPSGCSSTCEHGGMRPGMWRIMQRIAGVRRCATTRVEEVDRVGRLRCTWRCRYVRTGRMCTVDYF